MWASYDRALFLTNYRNNSWPTQIELDKLTIDNIKLSEALKKIDTKCNDFKKTIKIDACKIIKEYLMIAENGNHSNEVREDALKNAKMEIDKTKRNDFSNSILEKMKLQLRQFKQNNLKEENKTSKWNIVRNKFLNTKAKILKEYLTIAIEKIAHASLIDIDKIFKFTTFISK